MLISRRKALLGLLSLPAAAHAGALLELRPPSLNPRILVSWGAWDATPLSQYYATLDVRDGANVLDFDDISQEYAEFEGVLPKDYVGGDLTAEIYWLGPPDESGSVVWSGSLSTSEWKQFSEPVKSENGDCFLSSIRLDPGALDGGRDGAFSLRIARETANPQDTLQGDAEVLQVVLSTDGA